MTAAPEPGLLALARKTQRVPPQPEATAAPTTQLRPGHTLVTLPEEIDVGNGVQVQEALVAQSCRTGRRCWSPTRAGQLSAGARGWPRSCMLMIRRHSPGCTYG